MERHQPNVLSPEGIAAAIRASVLSRRTVMKPFEYAVLEQVFPAPLAACLAALPIPAPSLDGISGGRDLHNESRCYFNEANMRRFPAMAETAAALQTPRLVGFLAEAFGAALDGTYLRLEYAQDVDGFWLEPHTDLGVKKFTCLIYLSAEPGHEDLGTDLYWGPGRYYGRAPMRPNGALIFVPGPDTWHGFEKRPFAGIRRSVILNYVTPEWRAREQLSFPDAVIRL